MSNNNQPTAFENSTDLTFTKDLKVLVTRPEKPAIELAGLLEKHGIATHRHTMFHYQTAISLSACQSILKAKNTPILIFISVAAVEHANQVLPLSQWQNSGVIAVGSATQAALKNLNLEVHCPNTHDSEGMLNLPLLASIENRDIVIIRGDGGRELLAEQLGLRGANVCYLESYKRVWLELSNNEIDQWQAQNINCILITSNALLESVVHLLLAKDNYWKNNCLWVVASERIANNAKALGLVHVINANGASNESILTAIEHYGMGS